MSATPRKWRPSRSSSSRPAGRSRATPLATGTLDTILVHPREVFRPAIVANAAAIVLVHNHPSGDPTPSEADIKVTRDLIRAGQLIEDSKSWPFDHGPGRSRPAQGLCLPPRTRLFHLIYDLPRTGPAAKWRAGFIGRAELHTLKPFYFTCADCNDQEAPLRASLPASPRMARSRPDSASIKCPS